MCYNNLESTNIYQIKSKKGSEMIELIKSINQDYAGFLACLISFFTLITTIVYVLFTYSQMKATKESVKVMQDGMKQEKQPCIGIEIETASIGKCFGDYGRRQMFVEYKIENIGDSSALSVYCISNLKLNTANNNNGEDIVKMDYYPHYIHYLRVGQKKPANNRYENRQIDFLFKDYTENYDKNMKRIEENPRIDPYPGPEIEIHVLYKNMNDQWFESYLRQEIFSIEDTNDQTHTYLPPQKLESDKSYSIKLVSNRFSPFQRRMVDSQYVKKMFCECWDE